MPVRDRRGHFILEAMVASAVLLLTIAGVATAVRTAATDVGIAADEQQAMAIADAELEKLLLRPAREWVSSPPSPVPGHPGWILTVEISVVVDPVSPGATFKRAEASVAYRDRHAVLEAFKW